MRKFFTILTIILWILVIVVMTKYITVNQGLNHLDINITSPHGTLGWLVDLTLLVTAIDYIYYYLIHPKKNSL
ncbi:hypothetical protein [Companilactobacillus crustorum]|uniref:hypothetical protein n=1 Tax=Companilactobacillus crustorum TaxID=392416 RepID=UPI00096A58CB|nr:hypothetical protein [Companilactobacillus crustorum]WDT65628.1 hypothetical protein NV391_11830 [Companilactobacillus crustorum]HCD06823.1 hypothetical protein [Lactobacillus sp.]